MIRLRRLRLRRLRLRLLLSTSPMRSIKYGWKKKGDGPDWYTLLLYLYNKAILNTTLFYALYCQSELGK